MIERERESDRDRKTGRQIDRGRERERERERERDKLIHKGPTRKLLQEIYTLVYHYTKVSNLYKYCVSKIYNLNIKRIRREVKGIER